MIDIIIPAYNAHKTIKNTLFSILMQSIIKKINVYIIDDCSKKDYKEEYNFFREKMNIKLYRLKKNSGPGVARQYGIDKSNSKYIMFIDSDDVLYNYLSVENIYNVIKNDDLDAVSSDMIEKNGNELFNYSVGFDTLHSKIYKRDFLKKNNIVFPSTYNSEDLAFNNLFLMNKPKIGYCQDVVYVYKRFENSLTTTSNYWTEKHIKYYTKNLLWTIKMAKMNKVERGKIGEVLVSSFAYLYYYFCYSMKDETIEYIYDLIPYYEEYEKELSEDEKYLLIEFWLERLPKYQVDMSFKQFIRTCKRNYLKRVRK